MLGRFNGLNVIDSTDSEVVIAGKKIYAYTYLYRQQRLISLLRIFNNK